MEKSSKGTKQRPKKKGKFEGLSLCKSWAEGATFLLWNRVINTQHSSHIINALC